MEEFKNKELEQLLSNVDGLNWSYTVYHEPEETYNGWLYEERNYVKLEKYSPAGEDFGMIIDFNMNNPIDSFMDDLKEYSKNFDVDEHVEMWLLLRGKDGCPESISELVEDAKDIKNMIMELWGDFGFTMYGGVIMDNKVNFIHEELQLLYAACMSYGDKLSQIVKSIPNEETDKLADRAKESWNLARKITEYMEE